jgi:[protein-PII] uridylyltransferase
MARRRSKHGQLGPIISTPERQPAVRSSTAPEPVAAISDSVSLSSFYQAEFAKIRSRFEVSHDGQAAVRHRSDLLDALISQLWSSHAAGGEPGEKLCVAALGGYGRQALFPCSDVDLIFLSETELNDSEGKQVIRAMSQALWDLHLRVSPTTRTLPECGRLHRDNLEFNISLLDCRYICGNQELFEQLHQSVIPRMVACEALELQQRLIELTWARHHKYGNTIFHLEPNIKECPGGMRDYQVGCWLALITAMEKTGDWPRLETLLPGTLQTECSSALGFLSAVRCFLHYHHGRDLNGLTYELQAQAAAVGIGMPGALPTSASEWMRGYFRHARSIYRLTVLFDEIPPARSGLYRLFEHRKSRLSNADFSVVEGRVFLRQLSSVKDASVLSGLFEFTARHGLKLSAETERCVEAVLPEIEKWAKTQPDLWLQLKRILILPNAGAALRAMHRIGLLVLLFPELQAIDSLVIRDYYHRYTVDEHSIIAIENVHALRKPESDLERRFRDILEGVEQPELLFFALLLHDVGKGVSSDNHVQESLNAVRSIFQRVTLPPVDREIVEFLVENHLRMSATITRRDIFDPKIVSEFSESVGTAERLKMLTLLTYADIKSVNPDALTPWKAEMLWQLYAAAFNHLSRSVDDQRLHGTPTPDGGTGASPLQSQITKLVSEVSSSIDSNHLASFLEGFPKRYLLTHSSSEISIHYRLYERMAEDEPQIEISRHDGHNEMILLTLDHPFLFASVVGTLSSWGMNILKADAWSNRSGIVLDVFRFSDRFRTLDLNPGERDHLKKDLADAVSGRVDVAELMDAKFKPAARTPKIKIDPRVYVDNACSAHSTLIEITAADRPGLLYDVTSTLSELGCNIEIALIDTQGHTASDVFYVTSAGAKLDAKHQQSLRTALLQQL